MSALLKLGKFLLPKKMLERITVGSKTALGQMVDSKSLWQNFGGEKEISQDTLHHELKEIQKKMNSYAEIGK